MSSKIDEIISQGVEIPLSELLTYYLFHRLRINKPGWRNYNEIGATTLISRSVM
jgi:hypothetical protein